MVWFALGQGTGQAFSFSRSAGTQWERRLREGINSLNRFAQFVNLFGIEDEVVRLK
jgi:hypothetical protein